MNIFQKMKRIFFQVVQYIFSEERCMNPMYAHLMFSDLTRIINLERYVPEISCMNNSVSRSTWIQSMSYTQVQVTTLKMHIVQTWAGCWNSLKKVRGFNAYHVLKFIGGVENTYFVMQTGWTLELFEGTRKGYLKNYELRIQQSL